METTIFLARLFGLLYTIIAIGVLVNLKTYQNVIVDFSRNSALIYLGGVFALLFGILLVLFHNIWVAGWAVIITLLGWIAIVKGVVLIVFPGAMKKMMEAYHGKTTVMAVQLVIVLAFGIFLIIKGFFT